MHPPAYGPGICSSETYLTKSVKVYKVADDPSSETDGDAFDQVAPSSLTHRNRCQFLILITNF